MKLSQIIVTAALLSTFWGCSKEKPEKKRPPIPVETGKVIAKDTPIYVDSVGNIEAWYTIDVRSQVTGVLKEAHVKEGQEVAEGQLVYTIDPDPYIAALEKAKAQLREDEASLKLAEDKIIRYGPLAKLDYISQLQYDELITNVEYLKAKMDVDKAQIAEALVNLEYCYIHSPINGKISYNVFVPGNLITANAQQQMTTIRQLDPIYVNFSISQKDYLKFEHQHTKGETNFIFTMLDTVGKQIEKTGSVYFLDNNFSTDNGSILLRGKISNATRELWPGQFGKVQVIVKTIKNALSIPYTALQIGQQGDYIYVLKEDDTVEQRNIKVIEKAGDYIIVEEGVKEGEIVIINGQINLRPGASVIVKEPTPSEKGAGDDKKKTDSKEAAKVA